MRRPPTANIRTTNRSKTWQRKSQDFSNCRCPAGAANPSPPIGPALGQRGLNIMEFCKQFNAQTAKMEKGTPIPVVITTYADRSFTFEMKTPPVSYFIKKAAKLESGSKTPGRDKAGAIYRSAGARDRRAEDEGPELRHHRLGHEDGRRFRPLDGHRGHGVIAMANLGKRTNKVREGVDREKLYLDRRSGEDDQGARQGEVRRDHRDRDESRRRSASRRPDGARRGRCCRTAPAAALRVGVFARGAKADEARAAGADVVGAEDLVEKVQGGNDRFRPLHRHARPDAAGRPARQGARARAA